MKNTTLNLLIVVTLLLLAALAPKASAQTFGGSVTIVGTTNAPLYDGALALTNSLSFSIPSKSVYLGGISYTNETVIFTYGIKVLCLGSTNAAFCPLASITNAFSGGTNAGTWSTNITAQVLTFTILPYAQVATGIYTNTIYVP